MTSGQHAARLREVQAEIEDARERQRRLIKERGQIVSAIVTQQGWKAAAQILGVGHSRVYAMIRRNT